MAVLISLILPIGIAQMILGQALKGVVILLATMVLFVLTAGAALVVIYPANAIDAYQIAKKRQAGQPVGPWEFF